MNKNLTASVLIPIINVEGTEHILFEKRSLKLTNQPGDSCFPGGIIGDGESPMEAAMRETCEELLIDRSQVINVKKLDIIKGPPNIGDISVFLGELLDYNFTFSRAEVGRVFSIPKDRLLNLKSRGEKPEFYYEKERIWGFTARALARYIEYILQQSHSDCY